MNFRLLHGDGPDHAPARGLLVENAGVMTTVQDLGRPGLAHLGVTASGAADRRALRLANRLVGNPERAAGLEVTLGGLRIRALGELVVAVTGAACPVLIDDRPVGRHSVLSLRSGSTLSIGTATAGLRGYVAVRGGLEVPEVLGSRSTDTLSRLGPPVLVDGELLPVGSETVGWPVVDGVAVLDPPSGTVVLDVVVGPRHDLLPYGTLEELLSAVWTVSGDSDRVGLRLDGPTLEAAGIFLPSEGLVRGAVQLPPSGQPVIFLADHPVTGGYPVVVVVVDTDVDRAAQLRPGQGVRLRARHR